MAPLLSPSVLLIAVVFLIPVLIVVWVSLHRMDYFEVGEFVGLGQYADLLQSPAFWQQLSVTLIYVFGTLAVSVVAGFTIAILLQGAGRFRTFFRAALLLPWALSQATVAIAWVWMLNPAYGPVSFLAQKLGLPESLLLGSPTLALPLLIAVSAWWATPYGMVLFDAALQSLPVELYESAAVDGARARHAFVHLTLPLMKSTIAAASTFLALLLFAIVTLPLVLTGGGPLNKTETLSLNLFTESIIGGQSVGRGAAVAIVVMLANMIFGAMMLRYGRDKT
ncbi:carbohydrate ABC transporter permease [Arthrobacter sp. NPDC056727]|uniref:carbohydrate ABC transporter permease n=1 Tax=Arthrobacter sp. NPDC056727 TaxID=3345927 RepID=UPI00366A9187